MKKPILLIAAILSLGYSCVGKAEMTGTYGLHLFFNEKEFIDIVKISKGPGGQLIGDMIVPNDFNGKLLNIKHSDQQMSFDLFVPKNSARPKDMIFSYRLIFFDNSTHSQFVGFVNLQGQPQFVASFVGFKRSESRQIK